MLRFIIYKLLFDYLNFLLLVYYYLLYLFIIYYLFIVYTIKISYKIILYNVCTIPEK